MRSTTATVCSSEQETMAAYQKQICGSVENTFVYVIGAEREAAEITNLCTNVNAVLIFVPCADWNRQLSPWYGGSVFPGSEDFAGEAPAFLRYLVEDILPYAEYGITPRRRFLAGYSLAGLFALWSLYQTDRFHGAASMSGSLWYDGFVSYAETHSFVYPPERIVLSVGGREKNTKNSRVQCVEACTRQLYAAYRAQKIDTRFTLHPGGHFANVPGRIADGIHALVTDTGASHVK